MEPVSNDHAVCTDAKKHSLESDSLMGLAALSEQELPVSTLYIVALPIGNSADITLRALWVLSRADIIACEDTRETRKILDRYAIQTPTISVREHNEAREGARLIERLSRGERVALVTDAGTPAVSDPGAKTVEIIRSAGFRVVPVPGCSAVICALSAAGLAGRTFTFVGFVPPTAKARADAIDRYAAREDAFVLYEAPHRIRETLTELAKRIGADRRVVVARELTKRFETIEAVYGADLAQWAQEHEPRGEYVIAVDCAPSGAQSLDEASREWILSLMGEMPDSRLAAIAAKVTGLKRDVVYRFLQEQKER